MNQSAAPERTEPKPTGVETSKVEAPRTGTTLARSKPRPSENLASLPEPPRSYSATVTLLPGDIEMDDPSVISSFRNPPVGTSTAAPT